jgi:hypothetical protein
MPGCTELKEGDVYTCGECGLEFTVSKACGCGEDDATCTDEVFTCCGHEMNKK